MCGCVIGQINDSVFVWINGCMCGLVGGWVLGGWVSGCVCPHRCVGGWLSMGAGEYMGKCVGNGSQTYRKELCSGSRG